MTLEVIVAGVVTALVAVWVVYTSREDRPAVLRYYARLRSTGTRLNATVTYVGWDEDTGKDYLRLRFVSPAGAVIEEPREWHAAVKTPEVGAVVAVLFLTGDEWCLETDAYSDDAYEGMGQDAEPCAAPDPDRKAGPGR